MRQFAESAGAGGSPIGNFVKWAGYTVVVVTFIGVMWKPLVAKVPPGQAGVWLSWNKVVLTTVAGEAVPIAKIAWEGMYFKFPWRKVTLVSLAQREDKADEILAMIDKKLHTVKGLFFWKVDSSHTDDGPYRASSINVENLADSVRNIVTMAAREACRSNKIAASTNREEIFEAVHQRCKADLHRIGVVLIEFWLAEAVPTNEQIIATAMVAAARQSSCAHSAAQITQNGATAMLSKQP